MQGHTNDIKVIRHSAMDYWKLCDLYGREISKQMSVINSNHLLQSIFWLHWLKSYHIFLPVLFNSIIIAFHVYQNNWNKNIPLKKYRKPMNKIWLIKMLKNFVFPSDKTISENTGKILNVYKIEYLSQFYSL